jgi:hypothetical protein
MKTAKVLAVKAHDRGRIAFWEGRVAIYDGDPFLRHYPHPRPEEVRGAVRKHDWLLPFELEGWARNPGSAGRQRKGKMFLLNGEEEVLALIDNGHLQDCVPSTGRPTNTAQARRCRATDSRLAGRAHSCSFSDVVDSKHTHERRCVLGTERGCTARRILR